MILIVLNNISRDIGNSLSLQMPKKRHRWYNSYQPKLVYFHPIKISNTRRIDYKRKYCDYYIRQFQSAIFQNNTDYQE
jgi:hypothetical protein